MPYPAHRIERQERVRGARHPERLERGGRGEGVADDAGRAEAEGLSSSVGELGSGRGALEERFGGGSGLVGDRDPSEHPRDLLEAFIVGEQTDVTLRAFAHDLFVDPVMCVRICGDLWEVRDAKDLAVPGDLVDLLADQLGDRAADASVDLVEDVEARGGGTCCLARSTFRSGLASSPRLGAISSSA